MEQRTTGNGTDDYKNPSITLNKNNYPVILVERIQSQYSLAALVFNGTSWATVTVYGLVNYTQSSPSAIFVPQSVNGLANGRIWVAWHGYDATQTTILQVRVSYSDDGGVTWSAMQKLTTQANRHFNPTTSYDMSNNIYIYMVGDVTNDSLGMLKNTNGTWEPIQTIHSVGAGVNSPSAIEFIGNSSKPPIIFKDLGTNTIKFYGTWTVTTISVTQGTLGTKDNRNNLLTYAITTDGTMSTITEKVNGVVVGTKTATSGESLIAGLTQAQWDAVKFGKYADATGGSNTLTVEMGTEKWTYTFDKRLATTDDILTAVKANQDVQATYLPAVKSKLASAITAKGGTASGSDTWSALESAVGGIPLGKKWASGTSTSTGTSYWDIIVSGLDFIPTTVVVVRTYSTSSYMYIFANEKITELQNSFIQGSSSGSLQAYAYNATYKLYSGGFRLRFITNTTTSDPIYWYAYE